MLDHKIDKCIKPDMFEHSLDKWIRVESVDIFENSLDKWIRINSFENSHNE